MKNRQVALLAALAYQYKWARRNYLSPEEVIDVAKKFDDFLNYRDDIQDDPPPIPPRA